MYSTLIGTAELARHLGDPAFVIVDVRHDLAQPEHFGDEAYANAHVPGAAVRASRSRPVGAEDRPQRPPSAADAGSRRRGLRAPRHRCDEAGGRLRPGRRPVRGAAVVDAALARTRQCGGARRRLREVAARRAAGHGASRRRATPANFVPTRVRPDRQCDGRRGKSAAPRSAAARCARRRALSRRRRADRSGRRPHSRRAQSPVCAQPRSRRHVSSAARTAQRIRRMLHGRAADDVVHYCGSGVSACHNVLAMAIAGYPLARLYPGSWSEWSADPERPIARGQV